MIQFDFTLYILILPIGGFKSEKATKNPALTEEQPEHYIDKILDNSQKFSNLSCSILMPLKLENQDTVLNNQEFRLDEQIRKVILRLENRWTEKNIEFDMDWPKQMYYGSKPFLEQVWSNILDNAIKHSPHVGIIHVSIQHEATQLAIQIAD